MLNMPTIARRLATAGTLLAATTVGVLLIVRAGEGPTVSALESPRPEGSAAETEIAVFALG